MWEVENGPAANPVGLNWRRRKDPDRWCGQGKSGGRCRKPESPCSSSDESHSSLRATVEGFLPQVHLSSWMRWCSGSKNIRVFLVFVLHTHIFPKRVTLQTQVSNVYYIRIYSERPKLPKKNRFNHTRVGSSSKIAALFDQTCLIKGYKVIHGY